MDTSSLRSSLKDLGIDLPASAPVELVAELLASAPAKATLALVAGSAVAFYHAERCYNPKVRDIFDALLYCATCLNVGFAEAQPRTPIGKLIGTMLQTYGPALAHRALDGVRPRQVIGSECENTPPPPPRTR